jgi:hypothetical protein
VSIDGTLPASILPECSGLPALRDLRLSSSVDCSLALQHAVPPLELQDAAFPSLRTLVARGYGKGGLSLRLARVALPQLQVLHFESYDGRISLQNLALPSLTNLNLRSFHSANITGSALPLLQALRVKPYGSIRLAHTDMPALTTLQVKGGYAATPRSAYWTRRCLPCSRSPPTTAASAWSEPASAAESGAVASAQRDRAVFSAAGAAHSAARQRR